MHNWCSRESIIIAALIASTIPIVWIFWRMAIWDEKRTVVHLLKRIPLLQQIPESARIELYRSSRKEAIDRLWWFIPLGVILFVLILVLSRFLHHSDWGIPIGISICSSVYNLCFLDPMTVRIIKRHLSQA